MYTFIFIVFPYRIFKGIRFDQERAREEGDMEEKKREEKKRQRVWGGGPFSDDSKVVGREYSQALATLTSSTFSIRHAGKAGGLMFLSSKPSILRVPNQKHPIMITHCTPVEW